MNRRRILQLTTAAIGGCSLSACSLPRSTARPEGKLRIRAICFDIFTMFDPRSVVRVAEALLPGRGADLCAAWRTRQFEYSWIRTAGQRYADFRAVTEQSLVFASRERGLTLSAEQHRKLVEAYSELEPWPDTQSTLRAWKASGLRLAPLSNYSPSMLERVVSNAGLSDVFETLISTDAVKSFKPDPRAYALGPSTLHLEREEIAFAAFAGWDAAGAKWFGFPTFWVNRLGAPPEELSPPPDATGPSLAELGSFVTS